MSTGRSSAQLGQGSSSTLQTEARVDVHRCKDAEALRWILSHFGVSEQAELGRGGEAAVYALDSGRVLRVPHVAPSESRFRERLAFIEKLGQGASAVPFLVPTILDTAWIHGYGVTVEARIEGCSVQEALGRLRGSARAELIRRHLEASEQIGDITFAADYYGDVLREDAIRSPFQRQYLEARARRSLQRAGISPHEVDSQRLANGLPEPNTPSLVHLDAFAGNMMTDGERITGVIDFGAVSIIGDRRLDPLLSAAYLDPEITPTTSVEDVRQAESWLASRGLGEYRAPARAWIAAFWSECTNAPVLFNWCCKILKGQH